MSCTYRSLFLTILTVRCRSVHVGRFTVKIPNIVGVFGGVNVKTVECRSDEWLKFNFDINQIIIFRSPKKKQAASKRMKCIQFWMRV